jgi:hypothetical protein
VFALALLNFGRFCLGSCIYHMVRGNGALPTKPFPGAARHKLLVPEPESESGSIIPTQEGGRSAASLVCSR